MIEVLRVAGVERPCLVVTAPPGIVHVDGKEVRCVELAGQCAEAIARATGISAVVVADIFKFTLVAPGEGK